MVKGLKRFEAHFEGYTESFVIIGGVAASLWFEKQHFAFRATKDVDIVLLVETLDAAFLKRFWDFVRQGAYEIQQRSDGNRVYYCFAKPREADFPEMLELFSRSAEGLILGDDQTIIPMPGNEEASSLSAI